MAQERSNIVYRSSYQTLFVMLMVSIFIMLGMVTLVLYQVFNRPLPQFHAVAPNGQTLPLKSFDEPNTLPDTLLRWASKAAVASYTFDFVNYNKQILGAAPYFTADGWSDYQDSVAGLVQDIRRKQLFVNGVVSGAPVISNQGFLLGRGYVWKVQMPFLVTYQSAEETSRDSFMITMTIVKIPTTVDPTGIGIDQFYMK